MTIEIPAGSFEPARENLTALLDAIWRASRRPSSTQDSRSAQFALIAHELGEWAAADLLRTFVFAKEAGLVGYNLDNEQVWLTEAGFNRRRA